MLAAVALLGDRRRAVRWLAGAGAAALLLAIAGKLVPLGLMRYPAIKGSPIRAFSVLTVAN